MYMIELNYKKPKRCIDLVFLELGEATAERATTIVRILWRYGFTLDQVNEALQTLAKQGKVRKLHQEEYEPNPYDPCWCRIWWDDEDE